MTDEERCTCVHAGDDEALAACLKSFEVARAAERDVDDSRRRAAALKVAADYSEHVLHGHDLSATEAAELVAAAQLLGDDDLARLWNVLRDVPDDFGRLETLVRDAQEAGEFEGDLRSTHVAVAAIAFLANGERDAFEKLAALLPPVPPVQAPAPEPEPDVTTDEEADADGGEPTDGTDLPRQVPRPRNLAGKGSLPPRVAPVRKALDADGIRKGAMAPAVGSVAQMLKLARQRAVLAGRAAVEKAYERDAEEREEEINALVQRANRAIRREGSDE